MENKANSNSPLKKGFLVSIEGIDGSGKSLLIEKLLEHFNKKGLNVVFCKDPDDHEMGAHILSTLRQFKDEITEEAKFLLLAAGRMQTCQKVVIPALNKNSLVIAHRLTDSALAYQGYGQKVSKQMIKDVSKWVLRGIIPDITFYIKVDLEIARARMSNNTTSLISFEKKNDLFWTNVIKGFDEIYKDRKDVICLDGHLKPQEVFEQAVTILEKHIIKLAN